METLTPLNAALAVMILNVSTFMAFGWDKICAENRGWRVSEARLLGLALLGGIIGAYAGRALFRHKTRKQPFSNNLHSIAIFQALAVAVGAGWFFG